MHIRSKEINIINSMVLVLVLLVSILPQILLANHSQSVAISPTRFSNGTQNFAHRLRTPQDATVETYEAAVYKEDLRMLPSGDLGLTLNQIYGQGYRVWWNDVYLGQVGDPYTGMANIWNTSNMFLIDGRDIEDRNTLRILTYASYEVGASDNSVLLSSRQRAVEIKTLNDLYSTGLTLIAIGMAMFAVMIAVVHAILRARTRLITLALTLALVALSVHAADYLQLNYIHINYILYKKIVMTALFLALMMLSVVVAASVKRYLPVVLGALTLTGFVLGTALIASPINYKIFYDYMIILIPANFIAWVFILSPHVNTMDEPRILFGMLITITFVSIAETVVLVFLPTGVPGSPLALMLVISALLVMFMALGTIQKNKQLKAEIKQKDMLFHQTITDSLSTLYSRAYFTGLMADLKPPFAVAMMDIDEFKDVNDNYGHLLGDAGIKTVADTIRTLLRGDDLVGRYGGDEFIAAILCTPEKALEICERVRKTMSETPIALEEKKTNITISIGIYNVKQSMPVQEMLLKADKALYMAKEAGKNCVRVLDE